MIKIDSITKTFDTVKSLDNVSLLVENGSIFGLIGSNGSGKSTLLRIMCGVYRPDCGDIFFDGVPVWENAEVKQRMVYLSDDQYFITGSTPADMMRMYKSVYPTFSVEKYKHYMTQFGLDENRRLNTFSKGMQKQVSFILGLASCTDYLFCDETLDGLDPVMRQTVRHIIASEVAERGMTVVFASHNLKELEDICDHVALLHRGELLFEAGIDDIKRDIHKIQMGVDKSRGDEIREALKQLDTVSVEQRGSLFTIVARGTVPQIDNVILGFKPLFVEYIPLTLEEIFIAEMEERGYEFHESYIG
ncbi:MAG: ABC transporter ATP-binding protein [Clostridia bacterium]|nr:ABC transporter ATP-binding protein [Clostridia bacterium]